MKTTTTTTALLRALLWLGASMSALGAENRITSVDDFIKFKDNVNSGNKYSGTTVFLDSDLSLAGKNFEPIGNSSFSESKYFNGTFDGQGHMISNFSMTTSSSQYAGLFGFSKGLTIKNVILDSSCSITSSFIDSFYDACIGGIIGNCYADSGPCTIENSVNMGSVSFSGDVSGDFNSLKLGGIAGQLSSSSSSSSNHDSIVKNCANYGDITDSGESKNSRIGGIIGHPWGSPESNRAYIYNCLNHGTITHEGTTSSYLNLGGIAGYTYNTTIENCVSAGKISLLTTASKNNYTGSIVGRVYDGTSISYTYFASDLSGYSKYGYIDSEPSESNTLSYNSTTFELNGTVSAGSYTGTSLIDALNAAADYYALNDYSHWLLNKGNNAVTFTINKNSPFALNSQVILLPSLASEGSMSFNWFIDDGLTTPLTEFEVTSETELYGRYFCLNFTVTLDVNGGDELVVKEMTIGCDRVYGDLPNPTRTGYTFLGWFTGMTDGDKVESGGEVTTPSSHTLYAHWSVNKYTLTFIFGNGYEPEVRVLEFNETITYPAEPVREGYIFNVWSPKPDRMPADNLTITAQWTANNYTVTFNTNGGGSISQSTKAVKFGSAYGELPTPNRTGYAFLGWFTEKNESITAESSVKIPDNHTLYAHWSVNSYTLTFIFGNGYEPEVRVLEFNETITYPAEPVREGYLFNGWSPKPDRMPADNLTIYAQWTVNKYTVTFNPNGGSISQSTKAVTFGSAYGDLPTPNRTGHTFLGWFNEKNESITTESIVNIPDNHTLYAHWLEVTPIQVEIVFAKKDMGKEEIEEAIRKYTDADFKITVIESITDEMRVIVEFVDAEEANMFVRNVDDALDRGEGDKIEKVGFVQEITPSFSPAHLPMSLLYLI